jgi:hypothetical protein
MAEPPYTVRAGDGGWYQIAQKLTRVRGYQIDWRKLQRLNPQYVRPGDRLYGNGTEVLTLPPRPGTPPAGTGGTGGTVPSPTPPPLPSCGASPWYTAGSWADQPL